MLNIETTSVRLSKTNDGLDKLPDNALRNIIGKIFTSNSFKITLCLGKVEIPPPGQRKGIIREFHSSLVGKN